ncbi:hypothetical protein BS78_09G048900 [Paspalum vaginatum]|nr:hypothetical protein BS78_09G048900 [Paspalum vaginatum]
MAGGQERKRKSWGPLHGGRFGGGGVEKGALSWMAPRRKSTAAAVPVLMVPDTDSLDCDICYLPLRPPTFQCAVGHVVGSVCGDKLKDAGACHVCGVAIAGGGYRRCHAMERVVESIRAPCPHPPYGCGTVPAYHAREDHLRACPHAPCHCPAGEASCGFVGSTAGLLDHVASAHGWPCFTQPPGSRTDYPVLETALNLELHDGFQFVVSSDADEHGRKYVFLLNVVRHQFCRTVSVVCIRHRAAATKEINFKLHCLLRYGAEEGDRLVGHTQTTGFKVECSDLSDGLPDPNENFQLIVPK